MAAPRKRNSPPDYKPQPAKTRTSNWGWILIGMLVSMIGMVSYHVLDNSRQNSLIATVPSIHDAAIVSEPVAQKPPQEFKEAEPIAKTEPPREKISKPRAAEDGTSSASFEFYKLLPDMKVGMPEPPAVTPAKPASKEASLKLPPKEQKEQKEQPVKKPSIPTTAYMLQAGAFRTPHEAERLRAILAFKGLQSTIHIIGAGTTEAWHKVRLGPFTDFNQATQIQQRLRQEGISTILNKERS